MVDKRNETIAISFSQSFGGRGSLTDTAKDVPKLFCQRIRDVLHRA